MRGSPVAVRQAPLCLANDCHLVSESTRRSLRSADVSTCVVPPTLSSYGDRTFAATGPCLWNSLLVLLQNHDITSITKHRVPELIPVLCSQPAGDVSHKPGGRLPLLSARPAVTPATLKRAATNFAAL